MEKTSIYFSIIILILILLMLVLFFSPVRC